MKNRIRKKYSDLTKFNALLISEEEIAMGIDGKLTKTGSMLQGKFILFIFFPYKHHS